MDSSSWVQSLMEATHETTTFAPMDSGGSCPYCLAMLYDTLSEPEIGIKKVECLNCHKTFFLHMGDNFSSSLKKGL